MTHIYTAAHAAPAAGVNGNISTVASPRMLTGEEVAAAVAVKCQVPVTGIYHWPLTYPAALTDPRTALEQCMLQYSNCGRCHLADRRTRVVFYRGNPDAVVACVGEGPGRTEDTDGRPFVGDSGRLANEMFRECSLDPEASLFWMNLVACRPCDTRFEKDRPPTDTEKLACSERTLWLLRAVRPRVVLCLGNEATTIFWPEGKTTTPHPNTWHTLRSEKHPEDWIVVGVLRHPAYMLRILPVAKMYAEYAASRLRMIRELRDRLPALTAVGKVKTWWPGLNYVDTLVAPVAGGGT